KAVAIEYAKQKPETQALLVARKESLLKELSSQLLCPSQYEIVDFANENSLDVFLKDKDTSISRLLYFAGGGPYGDFASKAWKDHMWSFQVNFLTPSRIIHHFLKQNRKMQIVVVGSAVADDKPDPMAASYAAGKHGLKGLVGSIQAENPELDLRIFRPGYMD